MSMSLTTVSCDWLEELEADYDEMRDILKRLDALIGFNEPIESGGGYQFYQEQADDLNSVMSRAHRLLSKDRP